MYAIPFLGIRVWLVITMARDLRSKWDTVIIWSKGIHCDTNDCSREYSRSQSINFSARYRQYLLGAYSRVPDRLDCGDILDLVVQLSTGRRYSSAFSLAFTDLTWARYPSQYTRLSNTRQYYMIPLRPKVPQGPLRVTNILINANLRRFLWYSLHYARCTKPRVMTACGLY